MSTTWNITLLVRRQKGGGMPYYDEFKMQVDADEYVLDVIERVWAFHDRSLCFSHACHHSTCGACGMRINNVEKLTCITPVREVTADGGTVKVDPLRNFPVISDLAVDMGRLFTWMEEIGHRPVLPLSEEPAVEGAARRMQPAEDETIRLSDCIECGLCISACPIAATTEDYLGPAVLAGAYQRGADGNGKQLALADRANGVWRCHHAFACTEVCPSYVVPGTKIMNLRKRVMRQWIGNLFWVR